MDGGSEFCWSLCWVSDWIARLCKNGFLPMAAPAFADLITLLPKLHNKRCCLTLNNKNNDNKTIKVSKKVLKRVKPNYKFTVSKVSERSV